MDELRADYAEDPVTEGFLFNETLTAYHFFLDDTSSLSYTTYQVLQRLYDLNIPQFKFMVLRECHSAPIAGHIGLNRTLQLVTQDFFWPRITRGVILYCSQCLTCQQSNNKNKQTTGLLTTAGFCFGLNIQRKEL